MTTSCQSWKKRNNSENNHNSNDSNNDDNKIIGSYAVNFKVQSKVSSAQATLFAGTTKRPVVGFRVVATVYVVLEKL